MRCLRRPRLWLHGAELAAAVMVVLVVMVVTTVGPLDAVFSVIDGFCGFTISLPVRYSTLSVLFASCLFVFDFIMIVSLFYTNGGVTLLLSYASRFLGSGYTIAGADVFVVPLCFFLFLFRLFLAVVAFVFFIFLFFCLFLSLVPVPAVPRKKMPADAPASEIAAHLSKFTAGIKAGVSQAEMSFKHTGEDGLAYQGKDVSGGYFGDFGGRYIPETLVEAHRYRGVRACGCPAMENMPGLLAEISVDSRHSCSLVETRVEALR